ncbi:MAG: MBL fold metallo-hydrolase [Thermoplasmata archaeon]
MDEVFDGIYRVKVPLPKSPLRFVNSYIVMGNIPLIIDTGFNNDESFEVLNNAIEELGIKNMMFFVTHIHADHIGLIGRYLNNSGIFISQEEYKIIEESSSSNDYWIKMNEYLIKNGFPKEELELAFNSLNKIFIGTYPNLLSMKFLPMKEEEKIIVNGMNFSVINTPGHSPGHACLYNNENGIIFSGDHILFTITPNITWWPSMEDSLKNYMDSLKKIRDLKIEKTFPGHGEMGGNPKVRIEEILKHHEKRLEEIVNVMDGELTPYEIASSIRWNLLNGEWNIFPKTQKYFALGETIAHLVYLERKNIVRKFERNGIIYYKKTLK